MSNEIKKIAYLDRAQDDCVALLRVLTQAQGLCANVHGADFHAICQAIDAATDISAEIHNLRQRLRYQQQQGAAA